MIIGISGKAGCGKDFITRNLLVPMITENSPYVILSFADHFKFEAIVKNKLDNKKVFGRKDKYTRTFLQEAGTEKGRDVFGEDIWVNILKEQIEQYKERGIKIFFITDCRFPNEIKFIKDNQGITIRIEADDRHSKAMITENNNDNTISSHPSENGKFLCDYTINNREDNLFLSRDVRNLVLNIRNNHKNTLTIFCDIDDTIVECKNIYNNIVKQVKDLFIKEELYSEQTFDILFAELNTKRLSKAFTRDCLFKTFLEMLRDKDVNLNHKIREISFINLHNSHFSVINKKDITFLEKYKNYIVFVTLGDYLDQTKKLFDIGLYGYNIECVRQKNVGIYMGLKHKYNSKNYLMFGDSLDMDISPAIEVGIDAHIVDKKNPLYGKEYIVREILCDRNL